MAQIPARIEAACEHIPGLAVAEPGQAANLTEILATWTWSPVQTAYVNGDLFLRVLSSNYGPGRALQQTQHCAANTLEPLTQDNQTDLDMVVVKNLPTNYTLELSKNVASEAAAVALWRQLQQLGLEVKYIKRSLIGPEQEIVKQAYFDEVLEVIRRYRPEVTEDMLLTADNVTRLQPLPFFGRRRLQRQPELTYAVVARIGRDSVSLLYQVGLRIFQGR